MRRLTILGAVAVVAVLGLTFAALSMLGTESAEAAKKVGDCGGYVIHANGSTSPPCASEVIITNGNIEPNGHHHAHLILGGPADQTLHGSHHDDVICAGGGNDTVQGHAGDDELLGEDGNDFLDGDQDNDQVVGGPGDDHLTGDTGDKDHCIGGPGFDHVHAGCEKVKLGSGQ